MRVISAEVTRAIAVTSLVTRSKLQGNAVNPNRTSRKGTNRVRVETNNEHLRKLAVSAGAVTELEVRTLEREVVQLVNVIRDIASADVLPGDLRVVKE